MNGCQDSIPYASSCNLKMSKAETFRGGIHQFGPNQLLVLIILSVIWQSQNVKCSRYTETTTNYSFISYCLWFTNNFCSTEIVLASTFLILVILMFIAWVSIYFEDGDGVSHHLSFTFRLFLHLFFSSTQTFWHSLRNNENKHYWKNHARINFLLAVKLHLARSLCLWVF